MMIQSEIWLLSDITFIAESPLYPPEFFTVKSLNIIPSAKKITVQSV